MPQVPGFGSWEFKSAFGNRTAQSKQTATIYGVGFGGWAASDTYGILLESPPMAPAGPKTTKAGDVYMEDPAGLFLQYPQSRRHMQDSNVESSNGSYNQALRLFTVIYITTLLAIEVSIFGFCLITHVSQLFGKGWGNHQLAETIMSSVLLAGLSVVPFVKDGMRWRNQVLLCPRWMWISALTFAAYGFTSLFWTPSLLEGGNGDRNSDQAHLMFVLGFETIPICVLYSALLKGVFSQKEKIRRAIYSILMLVPFFAALIWKSWHTVAGPR